MEDRKIDHQKKELRALSRTRRIAYLKNQESQVLRSQSKRTELFLSLVFTQQTYASSAVMKGGQYWASYVAQKSEAKPDQLLDLNQIQAQTGLNWCVPKILSKSEMTFEDSNLNKEVPREQITGFFIPGLAYDQNGCRLGQGGGYYDRYLSGASALKVGLCLDSQILTDGKIPMSSEDICMDWILSDRRLIECSGKETKWTE